MQKHVNDVSDFFIDDFRFVSLSGDFEKSRKSQKALQIKDYLEASSIATAHWAGRRARFFGLKSIQKSRNHPKNVNPAVGVVEVASSKVQVQLQPFRKQFPFSVHKRIKLRYNKVPIWRLPFQLPF